jgi:hypothetical protein
MKKNLQLVWVILLCCLGWSCKDTTLTKPSTISPPTTSFAYSKIDTSTARQSSTITIYWSATVPDGFVGGYFVSFNKQQWTFTLRQDSTFLLSLFRTDTLYTISVAAVRTEIAGKYRTGQVYGNDIFSNVGYIDSQYPSLLVPIRNSPPTLSFVVGTDVPDTTFPVATFNWTASDTDGVNTLSTIEITLNDSAFTPANTLTLPATINSIALQATQPKRVNGTSAALVYAGLNINPLADSLNGLRLDARNVLYIRVRDASGALDTAAANHRPLHMPKSGTWYVKSVQSPLLVVDEYTSSPSDNAANIYKTTLSTIRGGRLQNFQLFNLKKYVGYNSLFYQRTFNLFDVIVWYSDGSLVSSSAVPTYRLANAVLPPLLTSGKNVLAEFYVDPGSVPPSSDLSFSPISSLSVPSLSFRRFFMTPGSADTARLQPAFSGYDTLRLYTTLTKDLVPINTLQPNADALYTLNLNSVRFDSINAVVNFQWLASYGTVAIARKQYSNQGQPTGKLILTPFYLHQFNKPNAVFQSVLEKVFRDEFNQ